MSQNMLQASLHISAGRHSISRDKPQRQTQRPVSVNAAFISVRSDSR